MLNDLENIKIETVGMSVSGACKDLKQDDWRKVFDVCAEFLKK